jgi:hypothetical protein
MTNICVIDFGLRDLDRRLVMRRVRVNRFLYDGNEVQEKTFIAKRKKDSVCWLGRSQGRLLLYMKQQRIVQASIYIKDVPNDGTSEQRNIEQILVVLADM